MLAILLVGVFSPSESDSSSISILSDEVDPRLSCLSTGLVGVDDSGVLDPLESLPKDDLAVYGGLGGVDNW